METPREETVAGATLEEEMNCEGLGRLGKLHRGDGPWPKLFTHSFIKKTFNDGQLCARHCSGSWVTVLNEVLSLMQLIFWMGEKTNKPTDKSMGVAIFIWAGQGRML